MYCGITLKWDYQQQTCELFMPGYIHEAVEKFQHGTNHRIKSVDAPHPYKATKKHGLPMTQPHNDATKLTPQAIKHLQKIVGTFLFYSRAVDPTILTALSISTTEQTQGTNTTKQKTEHFSSYATTHPNAKIKSYKSDMILKIHSDMSYLSKRQGRSRARGHFYLGNQDDTTNPTNGPILNTTGIFFNVMSAVSEAEAATLITNMNEGVIQCIGLKETQWPQPPTPITVDNSPTVGLAWDTIKANKSWAMDMHLHWIQDRAQQNQVLSYLGPRQTKQSRLFYQTACTHSPSLHAFHVSPSTIPSSQPSSTVSCQLELQGCIESQFPVPGNSPGYNQYSTGKLQHKSVTVA